MDRNQIITDAATEIMDRIEFRRGILRSDLETVVGSALDKAAMPLSFDVELDRMFKIIYPKPISEQQITDEMRRMGLVKIEPTFGNA